MTAGTIDGNKLGITVGDTLIACATSASMDLGTNMTDATCKDGDGAEQVKPGQQTWSMGVDGLMAFDSAYGWADLVQAWKDKTLVDVVYGTGETGDEQYSGSAYIDSLSSSAPLNEVATYTVNFRGTGELEISIVA